MVGEKPSFELLLGNVPYASILLVDMGDGFKVYWYNYVRYCISSIIKTG